MQLRLAHEDMGAFLHYAPVNSHWPQLHRSRCGTCLSLLTMPIYEFACPKCRKIYSFLSKRINPDRLPICPKCGNKKLEKQLSSFAFTKGVKESTTAGGGEGDGGPMPNLDDPRVARAMAEMERDMEHLDENNPKHMAHMMRKMKEIMPAGSVPKELDIAIKRLEAGEDPEKIEEDMGEALSAFMGDDGGKSGGGGYTKDSGLYDY
jgi:putative FmdB family regulatory protein